MSFGLKNASATYQRLMKKIFKPLIDQTVEVYIDDIVVKSKTRVKHVQHLEKAFCFMWAYNMKLNPAKCVFDVNIGKFIGLMVTQRGIEFNPTQVKFILETPTPSSKKELQCVIGRLATLVRFITCFIDNLRHFFLTLKGISMFT